MLSLHYAVHWCAEGALCHVLQHHQAIKTFNNRIWSVFLVLKMCTNSSSVWQKKTAEQTPISWETLLCRCTVVDFISSSVFSLSHVKLRNASTLMSHLSKKAGREKIELMSKRPLGYHPAGEIWQTSAIHAASLLITVLHPKLSFSNFQPGLGLEGKPRAEPEIRLQRILSSNHTQQAPSEHANSAVRYPWGKRPLTLQQHAKGATQTDLKFKEDDTPPTSDIPTVSSLPGWLYLLGLWGDHCMKGGVTQTKAVKSVNLNFVENFISYKSNGDFMSVVIYVNAEFMV